MSEARNDLNCRELASLIADCDPSDPDRTALTAVERHLSECPICQGAELLLTSAVDRFRDHEPASVSDQLRESLISQLCTGESNRPERSG